MAEFDTYARNYSPGSRNLLRRLFKRGADTSYVAAKVSFLLGDLAKTPIVERDESMHLLDFGCGAGDFLHLLDQRGFKGGVRGCDVSGGMLDEARRRYKQNTALAFDRAAGYDLPYAANTFDVVTTSCVFHHISPKERGKTYDSLFKVLRPGGRLFIFEHNPYHPLMRWAVSLAPEDANATLLSPSEVRNSMTRAGFRVLRTRHLLCLPPQLVGAEAVDRVLSRTPLGMQFVVVAEKPEK